MSAHVTPRPWSLRRLFAQALLLSLIPLGTAFAQQPQPYGYVRVTQDKTKIECFARKSAVCMTAPKGTIFEVLYTEGDRYDHRDSNRYWIRLPPDKWGRWVTGWVRGNHVEHYEPPPAPKASAPVISRDIDPRPEAPVSAPVERAPAARAAIPDVVLNFEFGKSRLTDEARRKLEGALAKPTSSNVQGLTIELEGHTDWIGSEAYNDRLGLARAETVARYLSAQLGFPADRISVVSHGERDPVAPNTTREGRAQNRRVVIKSGS